MSEPVTRRRVLAVAALAPFLAAAAPPQPSQPQPLTLGALYPLSGSLSLLGDESFRGLELAVEARNAAGGLLGRPVALVKGDAVDPNAATAEAKRLIDEAHVQAIFGTAASQQSLAASQVAEIAGVPYFELGAIGNPITERGFKWLFRSCPPASAFAQLSVDTITGLLGPAWRTDHATLRVAVLHEDGLRGNTIAASQTELAKRSGLNVSDVLSYTATAMDFAALVRRLRDGHADIVLHSGSQADIVQFYQAMKDAGWMPRMVIGTGAGYSLADTARAAGAGFAGTLNVDFPQYAIAPAAAPGAREVMDAYQKKYGMPPRSGHSLANYAGAQIFMDAIERAGQPAADKVRAAVLATDLAPGSTANGWGAAFDEHGQNTRARPLLSQWQQGMLVTVGPADAAVARPIVHLGT